jgi:hypothetical protein
VPCLFSRSSVVLAKKVLCDNAIAWKAWTEMRRAEAKAAGETVAGGSKAGGRSS